MPVALTRAVSPRLAECELTHLRRAPIDTSRVAAQHAAYEACLASLGLEVVRLPAAPELPDGVFVEDTAVVVDELAVLTRPGAASRRAELVSVAPVLARYRPLAAIAAPATLDGGDVLRLNRLVVVGRSSRSDAAGVDQLANLLAPYGYTVQAVPIAGCLHLKSAVTAVAADTLLVNPEWVDAGAFAGFRIIAVDPGEPHAANALLLGDTVLYPASFPRTAARLAAAGLRTVRVDVSELQKAEGAVTCCSLVLAC